MIKPILTWLTSLALAHATTQSNARANPDLFLKIASETNRSFVPAEVAKTLGARYPNESSTIAGHQREAEDALRRHKIAVVVTANYRGDLRVGDRRVATVSVDPVSNAISLNGVNLNSRAKTYADFVKSVDRARHRHVADSTFSLLMPSAEANEYLLLGAIVCFLYYLADTYLISVKRKAVKDETAELSEAASVCGENARSRSRKLALKTIGYVLNTESDRRRLLAEECAVQVARQQPKFSAEHDFTAELIPNCDAVKAVVRCGWPELASSPSPAAVPSNSTR